MTLSFLILVLVILLLAISVWGIAFKFGVSPFTLHQKLGLLVSIIAFVATLFMPIVSLGGAFNISLNGIISNFVDANQDLQVEYCSLYAPLAVSIAVFVPIIAIVAILYNRCLKWIGALFFISPSYGLFMFSCNSFLKGLGIGTGMYIYALCGIILIALPWFIKETQTELKGNGKLCVISMIIYALLAIIPAWSIQSIIMDDSKEKDNIEVEDELSDEDIMKLFESNEIMPQAALVMAVSSPNISLENRELFPDSNNGVSYDFIGKYKIQVVSDHGSMVIKAINPDDKITYLEVGDLFNSGDVDNFFGDISFANFDIDDDGEDELLIAARSSNDINDIRGVGFNIYKQMNGMFVCKSCFSGCSLYVCANTSSFLFGVGDSCNEEYYFKNGEWVKSVGG